MYPTTELYNERFAIFALSHVYPSIPLGINPFFKCISKVDDINIISYISQIYKIYHALCRGLWKSSINLKDYRQF